MKRSPQAEAARPKTTRRGGGERHRELRQPPRPGAHHRRGRRRSERHRHLFAGRRAVPLLAGLDAVPDDAADDRHPDALGAHRLRHRRGSRGEHRQDVPEVADARAGRAAGRRQHDQHRRRPGGDGRGGEAARRRPASALRPRLRRALHCHPDRVLVRAQRAAPEVADARPVRLRRGDPRRLGAVAARHRRIAAALEAPAGGPLGEGLRGDGGRRARHDHQPVPVLLAGLAGSRGRPPPAERPGAAQAPRVRGRAPVPHQGGHGRRHDLLEPDRAVHRASRRR